MAEVKISVPVVTGKDLKVGDYCTSTTAGGQGVRVWVRTKDTLVCLSEPQMTLSSLSQAHFPVTKLPKGTVVAITGNGVQLTPPEGKDKVAGPIKLPLAKLGVGGYGVETVGKTDHVWTRSLYTYTCLSDPERSFGVTGRASWNGGLENDIFVVPCDPYSKVEVTL